MVLQSRIHQLSPDLRRPGRAGSLIIPILDPDGDDRLEFLRWMLKPVVDKALSPEQDARLVEATRGFYAALFGEVRRNLIAESQQVGQPWWAAVVSALED